LKATAEEHRANFQSCQKTLTTITRANFRRHQLEGPDTEVTCPSGEVISARRLG
jgi:hypothetical protein